MATTRQLAAVRRNKLRVANPRATFASNAVDVPLKNFVRAPDNKFELVAVNNIPIAPSTNLATGGVTFNYDADTKELSCTRTNTGVNLFSFQLMVKSGTQARTFHLVLEV